MRAFLILAILCALFSLSSCSDIVATETLALRDEAAFDTGLLGTWFDADDTMFTVASITRPLYEITVVDRQRQRYLLQGRLAQIGGHRIIDVTDMQPALYSIPGHAWLTVEKRGNGLELHHLDSEWLQAQVRRSGVSHTLIGGRLVLTAPTERLRAFVERYGLRAEAQSDAIYLTPMPQHQTD